MTPSGESWLDLSLDTFRLGLEAGDVIGRRIALAARGDPRAFTEAALMVSEKTSAAIDAHFVVAEAVFAGEAHLAPALTVALYRRRVQANQRRLIETA